MQVTVRNAGGVDHCEAIEEARGQGERVRGQQRAQPVHEIVDGAPGQPLHDDGFQPAFRLWADYWRDREDRHDVGVSHARERAGVDEHVRDHRRRCTHDLHRYIAPEVVNGSVNVCGAATAEAFAKHKRG